MDVVLSGNIVVAFIGGLITGAWGFLVAPQNPKPVTEQRWFLPGVVLFTVGAAAWTFLFAPAVRLVPGFWSSALLFGALPALVGMFFGAMRKRA